MNLSFHPAIPSKRLGELKDLAQEVAIASATLDGRIAEATAEALGDRLRYLNSYYSNLIEGHKTSILEIEAALKKNFSTDDQKRYAQELCAAHVEVEREMMREVLTNPPANICDIEFVGKIHRRFFEKLPEQHRFTHSGGGFTGYRVMAGQMRNGNVSLDGGKTAHGPDAAELPPMYQEFAELYHPDNFHGDERLIAVAASHHRLAWLHPFRDGNGRVTRLFSGLYMTRAGINRSNLWSLSRGFSRDKQWYMINIQSADSPDENRKGFDQAFFADFCHFFLETCLDQIRFMEQILGLQRIDSRIDGYIRDKDKKRGAVHPLDPKSAKLLKALFLRGEVPRGEARAVMGMEDRTDRHARRIVSQLVKEGLVVSDSHRAPLKIGFPTHILRYYFPDLFDPSVFGETPIP